MTNMTDTLATLNAQLNAQAKRVDEILTRKLNDGSLDGQIGGPAWEQIDKYDTLLTRARLYLEKKDDASTARAQELMEHAQRSLLVAHILLMDL